MKCPTCSAELIDIGPGARSCPKRHGLLVTAKILKEAGTQAPGAHLIRADAGADAKIPATSKRLMNCPNCLAMMAEVDYGASGIMIDQCFSCPYRWLDAGEFTKITGHGRAKGRLRPDQLLALEGLGSALKDQT